MTYDFKQLKKQLSKFLGYYSRSEPVLVPHRELLKVYQPRTAIDWIIAQGLGGCSVLQNGKPVILISKKHAVSKTAAIFIIGHEIVEEYLRNITGPESADVERIIYSPDSLLFGQKFPPEILRKTRQRIARFLLDDDYTIDLLLEELIRDKEKEPFVVECRAFNHRSLKEGFCTILGGILANYDPSSNRKAALKEELIGAVERAENHMKDWQSLEKLETYRSELTSWDFQLLEEMAVYTTLIYDSGILKCINDLRSKAISAWEEALITDWARNVVQVIKQGEGLLFRSTDVKKPNIFLRSLKELEKTREIYIKARSKAYLLGLELDRSMITSQDTLSPVLTDLENLLE